MSLGTYYGQVDISYPPYRGAHIHIHQTVYVGVRLGRTPDSIEEVLTRMRFVARKRACHLFGLFPQMVIIQSVNPYLLPMPLSEDDL